MIAIAMLCIFYALLFIFRVGYGQGAPNSTTVVNGGIGAVYPLAIAILLPPVPAIVVSLAILMVLVYVAFTVWVPERFLRWSISTRARTNGLERDYPTTRLWRVPGPVFDFLARHPWSVRAGLLLPDEQHTGQQRRFRDSG